jgi:STE24 endopeptidase
MTSRGWAAVALAGFLTALVVVLVARVPWSAPPAPRSDQTAALHGLAAETVARGRAFRAALRPSIYGTLVLGLTVTLLLGLTPLGARLVELAGRPFGGHWLARVLIGGLVVAFTGEVVALPFAAWQHRVLNRYGLSTQDWGGWAVDLLKGYAVGAVIAMVGLFGFYAVAQLAPRWWWAWGAAGAAGLVTLLTFVFPVVVEPVFNRFTPMPAGELRSELVAMAARDGVPVKDVLVADASRRTTALNAYVSGLGPTRRIVVYDTLLREAPPAEVSSVVAHELGHAKDRDVATGTLVGALGAAAAVCALYLLGGWLPLLRRAGVDSLADPRSIGLLLAVAALVGLVGGPAQNLVSRRIEARADAHALDLTRDPASFESMEVRLSAVNLADPDPNRIEYALFASHPSTVERIAAGRTWARVHGR